MDVVVAVQVTGPTLEDVYELDDLQMSLGFDPLISLLAYFVDLLVKCCFSAEKAVFN